MSDHTFRRREDTGLDYRDNISDNATADDHDTSSESDIAEFFECKGDQDTVEVHDTAVAATQQPFDVDIALAEFKDLYVRSSLSQQRLLGKMYRDFRNNPYFGGMMSNYFEPEDVQEKTFRFMDLPTELRLHVARYALAARSHRSPTWKWKKVFAPAGSRVGNFAKLEGVMALTLVSRQLHAELSPLLREANTFEFDQFVTDAVDVASVWDAFSLFARSTPYQQLSKMNIQFGIFDGISGEYEAHSTSALEMLRQIAQQFPATRIKIIDNRWHLNEVLIKNRNRLVVFIEQKGLIDRNLVLHDLGESKRTWRIFPEIDHLDLGVIQEALRYEGLEIACDWIEKGI